MLCFIKRGLHQFRYSPRLLLPLEEKHVTLAVVLTTVGRKHSLSNGAALSLYKQIPIAWDSKMPAFIGPHGAREKVGRGRGLFERSEFRSPDSDRSGGQEYPITSGQPFLVTSLRRERSYRQLSF